MDERETARKLRVLYEAAPEELRPGFTGRVMTRLGAEKQAAQGLFELCAGRRAPMSAALSLVASFVIFLYAFGVTERAGEEAALAGLLEADASFVSELTEL